jgi:hypothetical protein
VATDHEEHHATRPQSLTAMPKNNPRPGHYPRLNKRRKGVPQSTQCERMHRVIKAGGVPDGALRVQLDERTVITLKSRASLLFWQQRYPNLRVIP